MVSIKGPLSKFQHVKKKYLIGFHKGSFIQVSTCKEEISYMKKILGTKSYVHAELNVLIYIFTLYISDLFRKQQCVF